MNIDTGPTETDALAILVSGGLDSAILLAESLSTQRAVQPLYVRCGLYWEDVEMRHLRQFLGAMPTPGLRPLHVLHMPVIDLYPAHWSLTGTDVPDARSPNEAVFLPGRNVLLLAKAMLWCHLHGVPAVAMAPLESNPFPDATPAFFAAYEAVVNQAVGGSVKLLQPYLGLHKTEVLRRGRHLPLQWTFSCIRPVNGLHCGAVTNAPSARGPSTTPVCLIQRLTIRTGQAQTASPP